MRAPERKLKQVKLARAAFVRPPDAPRSFLCAQCGKQFPIPWDSQLKFEYPPIKSADGATWVLAGLPLECTHCKNETWFEIKTTPTGETLEFFGDEAFRAPIKGWYPLAYGSIAIYEEHIADLREKFLALKRDFITNRNPEDWILHVKVFRDQKKREQLAPEATIEKANEFLSVRPKAS
jgi:hypothetical protein